MLPPEAGNPGLLRVISGNHFFSSRKPKDFGRVETPTVTAAIRGTEFVVDVGDRGVTTITMIEGVVDASNSFGSVQVGAGEQAYVEPGKAPIKRIVVRPRDAVAWSLYYPRVLGGSDARRLEGMGADGRDLARAAELLSAGQVGPGPAPDRERPRARSERPHVALALASVIDVANDRKDEAYELARQAVESDPDSGAAALAMSFASQARFEIEHALKMAELAARLDPDSAEALARVAELRLASGDTRGAKDAAERAVRRDASSDARAHGAGLRAARPAQVRRGPGQLRARGAGRSELPPGASGPGDRAHPARGSQGRTRGDADRRPARSRQLPVPLLPRQGLLRGVPRGRGRQGARRRQGARPVRPDALPLRRPAEADLQPAGRGAPRSPGVDLAQRQPRRLPLAHAARRGPRGALGQPRRASTASWASPSSAW